MEDGGHVVFICTPQDLGENLARLEGALEELEEDLGPCPPHPGSPSAGAGALSAAGPVRPLGGPVPGGLPGEIAAVPVAPYPPGVPVVAPGSGLEKKSWPICGK